MTDRRLEEALRHLHPPAGTKLWHGGATVLGALRGLSPEVAAWKPYSDRQCIWELALHIAYWNYAVWRRITGEQVGGFPRSPADWPALPPERTVAAWSKDRRLLSESSRALFESIIPIITTGIGLVRAQAAPGAGVTRA
jgi:DinB superfamily